MELVKDGCDDMNECLPIVHAISEAIGQPLQVTLNGLSMF